jgi:serine/threonine-protein kinase HipA
LSFAERFTIRNAKGIIEKTQDAISFWEKTAQELNIPEKVIKNIKRDFSMFKV